MTDGREALLREDAVALAADTFTAVFADVGLGGYKGRNTVAKELRRRFGRPRGTAADHAHRAVALQIVLIWERARVVSRARSDGLVLLPDGVRLRNAPDVVAGLRALLG